jgi:phage tail-like protein
VSDPALSISYNVVLDGLIPLGTWTKVEGLSTEFEVEPYREGGVNGYVHLLIGPVKTDRLRLSRPVDSTSPLIMAWLGANMLQVIPSTLGITAMTAEGKAITTWNLMGVVPVKWSGPSLDIMSNSVATETLELVYEEVSLIGLASAAAGLLTGSLSASVAF